MPGRLGSPTSLPGIVLPRAPVSLLVTCAACRRDVLEADEIGDEDGAPPRSPTRDPPGHGGARDAERLAPAVRCEGAAAAGCIERVAVYRCSRTRFAGTNTSTDTTQSALHAG